MAMLPFSSSATRLRRFCTFDQDLVFGKEIMLYLKREDGSDDRYGL